MAVRPSKQLMSMLQAVDTGNSHRGMSSLGGQKLDSLADPSVNDIVEYSEVGQMGNEFIALETAVGANERASLYTRLTQDFGSTSIRGARSSKLLPNNIASARVSKLTPMAATLTSRVELESNTPLLTEEISVVRRIGTGLSNAASIAATDIHSESNVQTFEDKKKDQKKVKIKQETAQSHKPLSADGDMRWHEVQAVPVQDPVTGKDAVLLLQTDITSRAVMEQRMAALTESQLSMLEEMFPRHVLEFIMGAAPPESTLGDLAYQHDDVTILFMDIVGFTSMSKEVPAQMVMEFLNNLFSKFDLLLDDYDVYKVILSNL